MDIILTLLKLIMVILGIIYYTLALKKQSQQQLSFNKEISKTNFKKACLQGGILAGIITSFIIIIVYKSKHPYWVGYITVNDKYFTVNLIPFIFIFQISLATLLAYIVSKVCWSRNAIPAKKSKKVIEKILLFILSFVSIVLFRQLMARDALVLPNGYLQSNGTWGGGPLGEPDMETIATGIAGSIALLLMIFHLKLFATNNLLKKVPSIKEIFQITIGGASYGFMAWFLILGIYKALIAAPTIPQYSVICERWIFVFDFPHPERYFQILFTWLTYLLCILFSIYFYASPPSKDNYLVDVVMMDD